MSKAKETLMLSQKDKATYKFYKAVGAATAAATSVGASLVPAFASGVWSGAESQLTGIINGFRTFLMNIATPIAAAALLFCVVTMLVSQNQRKFEAAKDWLVKIIVCYIVLFAIPFILELAQNIGQSFT